MKILVLVAFGTALLLPNAASAQLFDFFGPKNYDECVRDNLEAASSSTEESVRVRIKDDCQKKFPSPGGTGAGWEVDSKGIGNCFMFWDGAKFVETARREKVGSEVRWVFTTSKQIAINLFIPDAILEKDTDGKVASEKIKAMFGGYRPSYLCGNEVW
jgi:hypothetical protein